MMELEKFMRENSNWEEILSKAPYHISIHKDGDYTILKYKMGESDFNESLVREARGSIFYNGVCVCHAFDKFGNWGEDYAATKEINWQQAKVVEKIDGSLIKVWFHRNWHISTNGTIAAKNASCPNSTYNFKMLFDEAIARIPSFWESLNPDYCYMFELTSPHAQIVIPYEKTELWFLGRRNMITGKEDNDRLMLEGLRYPAVHNFHSLEECIAFARELDENHEGFVVVDKDFRRIKVKGEEYLKRHYARANNNLTPKKIFELWKKESLDDFLVYAPNNKLAVAKIVGKIFNMAKIMDGVWDSISFSNKRELADLARNYSYPINPYLFFKYDGKVENGVDFLKKFGIWKGELCGEK